MKREANPCPEPEVLAAFVAGNLTGEELTMTVEHLRGCEDCRRIVAEAVRFEPESRELVAPQRPVRYAAWAVAAGVVLALVALSAVVMRWRTDRPPMQALVAAAPRDGRNLEPRVSGGFPWAPLRRTERGPQAPHATDMKLVGAAGEVIEKAAKEPTAQARHASAVARLLTGSPADAASQLSSLAESEPSAEVWNDLAAASYAEALQTDTPSKLAQALAAADAAIRINPGLSEALFNRALILEQLGLREQARAAWERYLTVDQASPWKAEAEKHLRGLGGVTEFRRELDRAYAALGRDDAAVKDVVARFPQECRLWGESEILKRWAQSEIAGDSADAATHLRLAGTFGEELARRRDERMLLDAVTTIQRADPASRRLLAEAHVQLREAQAAHRSDGPAKAEPLFRGAAAKFERGGSPMALVAHYFAANMAYEQERIQEARVELERLQRQSSTQFRAQNAQVSWELGIIYAALGKWGQTLDSLNESMAGYEFLGEKAYAMIVREIVAEAYDRIGEPQKAWDHRIVALQELGKANDLRLQVAIYAIARGAALNHDWPVGLSFVNLQLEREPQRGEEVMHAHTLLLRASIQGRMGRAGAAASDLSIANAAIASIPDPKQRERAEAERLAVEGFLAQSPAETIELVSRAIDFQRTKERRMFLPELLLYRGRAFMATGRQTQAASDFEAGIAELEDQRISIDEGDARWGMFGTADELFDEAVLLAVQRGDSAGAFAYSERARARELLDSMGMTTVPAMPASLPDDVILEYVQFADRMIIFVVDGDRIRVVEQDLARSVVAQETNLLIQSASSGDADEFKRLAALLYDRLLGPVADELTSGKTLVLVPDGTLTQVPFAALVDPAGRYVIERRSVVVAPSVAVLSGARKQQVARVPRLLMVAGPESRDGDQRRLAAAKREADAILAVYGSHVEHAPKASVAEILQRHSKDADVIHFVGHAVLPNEHNEAALVTSRNEDPEDQLDVREIAAMRLRSVNVVVLAACGTARGYGRTGAPSVSLARAFLAAGVPSAVGTLWPIDDEPAAEFFPRFHHYLVRGLPPAEALRAVQLEWVTRPGPSSLGVWAAIQIIGT